ncbi:MAG TPA: DUF6544 family protein, partial [Chryseosolibacter sp.]|nr:DUF6544 family protein [Chryseosolibacter sp.]
MIRLIFASVLVLHGLLHMIGFAKEWNIGSQGRLQGKEVIAFPDDTSKITGTLWLTTGILFLTAAGFYLLRKEWYWIPAAGGVVISQVLIILYWQEARYGTLANIIIMIVLIFAAAAMHFNTVGKRESKTLQANAPPMGPLITDEMISSLPPNVQRWMRESGVVGKINPNIIHIRQKGSMRTKPDGKWMPFHAVQYFSIDPPSFVWEAKVDAAPFVQIAGRDKYEKGKGY